MKTCTKCRASKPRADFYQHKQARDGLHSYCKQCFMGVNRNWARRNPDKCRGYTVKQRYGLSGDQVMALLELQGGRCAICTRPIEFRSTGHVDHDHKTGRVRGVLCGPCNRAIGLLQDDAFVVGEAAAYLENHAERTAHG